MSHSNKDATLPLLYCAFLPEAASGQLYVPRDGEWGPPKESGAGEKKSLDAEQQSLLWSLSEAAVGEKWAI